MIDTWLSSNSGPMTASLAPINTLTATPNSYVSLWTPQSLMLSLVKSDHHDDLVTLDRAFVDLNKLCNRIRYFIVIETYRIYCSEKIFKKININTDKIVQKTIIRGINH